MGLLRMIKLTKFIAVLGMVALWVSSCVPVQQSGSSQSRTSNAKGALGGGGNGPGSTPIGGKGSTKINWQSGGLELENVLLVNEDFQSVVALKGETIEEFLNDNTNFAKKYCLVVSYNTTGAEKNLRLIASPIQYRSNNGTGSTVLKRIFEIDYNNLASATSNCSGNAFQITYNIATAATVGDSDAAFQLSDLCPTCTNIITSTNVSLYEVSSGLATGTRVSDSILDLSSFELKIDTASNLTTDDGSSSNSCSQTECQAKGSDYCCLNGQCVRDGTEKPNASNEDDYNQAIEDVSADPSLYKNYENIYFYCKENQPDSGNTDSEDPTDPEEEANEKLAAAIKQYNCLEEGKKDSPNFSGEQVCEPSFDQTSYEAVRSEVWKKCGCKADPFPTDPEDPSCPDYGLKLEVDSTTGETTNVVCDTPQPITHVPTPFQELNMSIPMKTAPHRFFRSDTAAAEDINLDQGTTYSSSSLTPEGTEFLYLDKDNFREPDNGSFNMNSITGQFTVDLDQAIPAQVVDVEFNMNYTIHSLKGYYTPCHKCRKDYWTKDFTAWPSSRDGIGLSATNAIMGYSANREKFNSNTTLGNYEDTIFGRACWLPPTMIPFSHQKNTDVATQRQNRLATQAAYFVNGYQRDWYGFNKGALIGSFDGVKWFAIGSGRRVKATSKKLFLAINAPYADLADDGSLTVQILLNNAETNAANFDYDPNISPNDPAQNTGGSCQYFHSCSSDSDCVSKLGWEYMCANVATYKTTWPKFNSSAEEQANDEEASYSFSKILQAGLPSGSQFRCVYRGAGAPCKKDYTTLDSNKQRLFTCAPNFYCADLGSTDFNNQIAREPEEEGVFQLGQEANVLGRPLNYIGGGKGLTADIQSNIKHNAQIFSADTGDFGICRPGKSLSATYATQHDSKDSQLRTDYINQISSCNSEATGDNRINTCPIFEMETGQSDAQGDYIFSIDATEGHKQNMCGQESKYSDGTSTRNAFESIELEKLSSLSNIDSDEKVVVQDACFRRAGSICHTDLDCSPNRLHASKTSSFSTARFGDTDAERDFWSEGLICGQATPFPSLSLDEDYFDYDMNENRCCRGVGEGFTMYSQDDDGIITDLTGKTNTGLDVTAFPYQDPTATGRYSRYVTVGATDGTPSAAPTTVYAQAPIVNDNANAKSFQWKTMNETGTKNCCGGGWIREFTDGSTSWSKQRLKIKKENFECLNFPTEIAQLNLANVDSDNYSDDQGKLCKFPEHGGCHQHSFPLPDGFKIVNPSEPDSARATLSTKPLDTEVPQLISLNEFVPYNPIPFPNATDIDTDDSERYTYFKDGTSYQGVSFYMPIYIGYINNNNASDPDKDGTDNNINNLVSVTIVYVDEDQSPQEFTTTSPTFVPGCTITDNPVIDLNENEWCVTDEDGHYVFHARATSPGSIGTAWEYAYVEIEFKIQNGEDYLYGTTLGSEDTTQEGMKPGNALYYLTKLGRLELLGVPQINYEPIYCNSNRSKLVGGIFNLTADTRTQFEANAHASDNNATNGRQQYEIYDSTNGADTSANNGNFVAQEDLINITPIFKSSEFRCCTKLNQKTVQSSNCCSGHSVINSEGNRICKLPSGANLHVYFNKFISGEGMDSGFDKDTKDGLPNGGLTDDDIIPETGEPKLTQAVYNKIGAMGQAFCESGLVREGGAFGFFNGEPSTGYIAFDGADLSNPLSRYGIIDSTQDNDVNNETGFESFNAGFKWDHQLYCQ